MRMEEEEEEEEEPRPQEPASEDVRQCFLSENNVFFKGTIPEAIAAAQAGWKILFVYVGGENKDSIKMGEVTWRDQRVIQCVSEWCISLHLLEGTKDATNFSALYPVSGTPNLTLLEPNGLVLKRHEGYICPEDLLKMLEQSILQLRNAAASAFISALSSSRISLSMNSASESCSTPSNESVSASSSIPSAISLHVNNTSESSLISSPALPFPVNNDSKSSLITNSEIDSSNEKASQSHASSIISSSQATPSQETPMPKFEYDEQITAECSAALHSLKITGLIEQNDTVDKDLDVGEDGLQNDHAESGALMHMNSYMGAENIQKITEEKSDMVCGEIALDQQMTSANESKIDPMLLQIRLTNGDSIQGHFTAHESLDEVKQFVDMNRTDGTCSYSLVVPYPRRVFTEQDMMRTLLELDIKPRATLMLVPKKSLPSNNAASTSNQVELSIENTATRSMFWQLISFLNPFSYWHRNKGDTTTHSSEQYGQTIALGTTPRDSSWQRDMNDVSSVRHLGGSLSREETSTSTINGQIQRNNLGSNIHTLQHDDDDIFRKANAYWNGNSTQFGADNSKPND